MAALKQVLEKGEAKAVGISRFDNADIESARNIMADHIGAAWNL